MSELNCRKLSWCHRIAGWGPLTPHIWCQKCGECGSGVRVRRKHRRKTSMDNATASAVRGHQGLPSQGRQSSGCSLSCKRQRIQSYFHAKRLTDIPGRNPVYLKVRCSNKVTPTSFLNKGSCQPPNPHHRPGTADVAHWAIYSGCPSDSSTWTRLLPRRKPSSDCRPQSPPLWSPCQTR